MSSLPGLSVAELNEISVKAWSRNADFWDAAMGQDGNDYFNVLELPALKRLVQPRPSEYALDVGTGNGLVARWLSSEGVDVMATDASEAILERAERRFKSIETTGKKGVIRLQKLDATNSAELEDLGGFDIITMNMVMMDIPTLEPLAAALPTILNRGGRFVATVPHPAFSSSGTTRHIEIGENPSTGREEVLHSIKVRQYLKFPPTRGEAIRGQPATQLYFTRSISELFAPFFKAGLVLDGLEELGYPDAQDESPSRRVESVKNFPQIPWILAFRFRRAA